MSAVQGPAGEAPLAEAAASRPEWARPLTPPEALAQPGVGVSILQRVSDWPRRAESAPEGLIVRCTANFLELKVNNVLPVGWFSFLFGLWVMPMVAVFAFHATASLGKRWHPGDGVFMLVLALAPCVLLPMLFFLLLWAIYLLDVKGGAGENLTVLDRASRTIYARLPKKLSKGEWNWDDLHPYTDRRNAISRVNEVLLLVELDAAMQKMQSSVQVEIGGMHREPLLHTYAFVKEFMDNGVCNLPPFQLTAKPEPAWYTNMPPWFFWLPRRLAKSIWAFAFLLFTWPIVVWARLLRRVLPYSRWPAEFEAKLKADEGQGTPAEKAWLASNVQPPESLPWMARVAFMAAVLVSAPYWWAAVRYYVGSLAKFVGA
jgi:hypothetical protein